MYKDIEKKRERRKKYYQETRSFARCLLGEHSKCVGQLGQARQGRISCGCPCHGQWRKDNAKT